MTENKKKKKSVHLPAEMIDRIKSRELLKPAAIRIHIADRVEELVKAGEAAQGL